jgi:hypothetical protein
LDTARIGVIGGSITASDVVLSNNTAAGQAGNARISGSTVSGNGVGLLNNAGGTLESFGDNLVHGNTTQTSGTITAVGET